MNEIYPVVSIITVCYNCQDTIEKTIKNVISQDYPDMQYIIIDGGSSDNTLKIIESFKNRINMVISEKDSGIYDAMNKGLSHAQGDFIYFLNSGDLLVAPDTIERIIAVFRNSPEVSLVHGDAIGYGEIPEEYRSMFRNNPVMYFSRALCHQTLFARKQVFKRVGNFNTHFSVFADRDWLFRCLFSHDEKIMHIALPVCYYQAGGFSSRQDATFFRERTELFLKYIVNQRIMVLLIKNPKELFLVLGLILYSAANVVSYSLFQSVFRMPHQKLI